MRVDRSPYDAVTPERLRRRGTIKWTRYGPDVLALWVAEMDFPTAPVVLEAIRDAVEREEFGYPRLDSPLRLGRAVAGFAERRFGWQVDPERVHLLPDVLKGVELGIDAFTPPGSPVILPTPAYMPFFDVPKIVGRPIVEVPMAKEPSGYRYDLAAIDAAFTGGARSIIVCQPHNPLGRCCTAEELAALCAIVSRHRGRVIADEIHAPLTYGSVHVPYVTVSDEAAAHALTLISASKGWNLPGLSCAAAIVTSDSDERRWQELSHLRTHGASTIGIAANIVAFESGEPWLDATLAYLDRNRHLLAELVSRHLPGVEYLVPEGTYLAWLDFSGVGLEEDPAGFFLERAKVAMNPGIAFGAQARACARLNFATSAAILERAVSSMGGALRDR